MKYPDHTISTPVAGKQAKRLLEALRGGKVITNPLREATIQRILKAKEARKNAAAHSKIQGN